MQDLYGDFQWPGAISVREGSYTVSHGYAPGVACIVLNPQPKPPAVFGDLIITDHSKKGIVPVPDCRLIAIKAHGSAGSEQVYTIELEDRRWRWRDLGCAKGCYNALDPSGMFSVPLDTSVPQIVKPTKYVPWTIQNIKALIKILLDTMGEINYTIVLPTFPAQPFPQINWDYVNPAQALQTLVDAIGCRIVYQLPQNTIAILPLGVGANLPKGSISSQSPSLSGLTTPDYLMLVGAPIRYQFRVFCEAVGEEWNGQLRPINDLSYAPQAKPVAQVVTWTIFQVVVGATYTVTVNGINYSVVAVNGNDENDIAIALLNQLNLAGALLRGAGIKVAAGQAGPNTTITVTGPADGTPFNFGGGANVPDSMDWSLTKVGRRKGGDWSYSAPPTFWGGKVGANVPDAEPNAANAAAGATATDRLTWRQARALAEKSVFKWYRIINVDPEKLTGVLNVPGFGKILRREQLLAQDAQIEQIQPTAGDQNKVNNVTGEPLIRDYYNGYVKSKPPACYGAYYYPVAGVILPLPKPESGNSDPRAEINVPFSIDANRGLVMFSQAVYVRPGDNATGWVAAAQVTLQTAFQVRDPKTNQIVRATAFHDFGGGVNKGQPFVLRADDFEMNFGAVYPTGPATPGESNDLGTAKTLPGNKVLKVLNDLVDAVKRSTFYLNAEAAKWELKLALQQEYNGIVPITLDGAIQQVTYAVSSQGRVTTTASRNSEHNYKIPSYPQRLQIEFLRAAQRVAPAGVQPQAPPVINGVPRGAGAGGGGGVRGGGPGFNLPPGQII